MELSSLAASRYSENDSPSPQIERALDSLDGVDVEEAFQHARDHVERTVQLWDWDEDVELIGVARVVALPANWSLTVRSSQRNTDPKDSP